MFLLNLKKKIPKEKWDRRKKGLVQVSSHNRFTEKLNVNPLPRQLRHQTTWKITKQSSVSYMRRGGMIGDGQSLCYGGGNGGGVVANE